ncbi:MAG TPA: hypothetical protein VEV44_02405 [Pseudoneobacillus sp.]|nr:hypothetical protein [Pseudoneobacillus sp.]
MKQIIYFAAAIALGWGMYYLYQRQLGTVSFFILSILFFVFGFRMLSNRK